MFCCMWSCRLVGVINKAISSRASSSLVPPDVLSLTFFDICLTGFLQTAASPTPGQARGKSRNTVATMGNFGLLDVLAALLWVRSNAPAFGGDPERVTLAGHGTGAALVNLMMISPLANGQLTIFIWVEQMTSFINSGSRPPICASDTKTLPRHEEVILCI